MHCEEKGNMRMIPGIDKLLDVVASGIGSVAGTLMAPWKARKEGEARVIAAKSDAEVLRIRTEAHQQARNRLVLDAPKTGLIDLSNSVSERIAYQEAKRIANIKSVVGKAALDLEDKEVPDAEPDHDWAARFFGNVQDISSENMQTLWSRVLSGEVERPGSTSIRTLSLLRDLDRATAELFSKFCSACIFLTPELGQNMWDARVISLGENASHNSLMDFGFDFRALNRLNEYGLIISEYNSLIDLTVCVAKDRNHLTVPFFHQGEPWVLVPIPEGKPLGCLMMDGVALSLSGRELSRVVEREPMPDYTGKLRSFLQRKELEMTKFHEWRASVE